MSRKRKHDVADKQAAKKATVLEPEKKSRLPLISLVVVTILAVGILSLYLLKDRNIASLEGRIRPEVTATEVSFPAYHFRDGTARFFQYPTGDGITVRFFILKSSDGLIRAAFDACDVCWREGKGYYQDGDFMVCRNCGRRFASIRVNEERGGCNPAPLDRAVVDGKLVLRVADILQGRQYFDVAGES